MANVADGTDGEVISGRGWKWFDRKGGTSEEKSRSA